jgi:hypothetical protein
VVLLRIYSGPTKLRLIAERLSLDGLRDARIEDNVPRAAKEWDAPIAKLAEQLFPEPPRPEERVERIVTPEVPEEEVGFFDVAPWVVLGTSVVALGVGAGFAVSSQSARDELLDMPTSESRFAATFDRMQTHGRVANGMFIGGAIGVAAGGVLLMFAD